MAISIESYQQHLKAILSFYDTLLETHHLSGMIIPSGEAKPVFLDDTTYPFKVNVHFKALVPLTKEPNSYIIYLTGKKPTLVYYQPDDYWHVVPSDPKGIWVDSFDIKIVKDKSSWINILPKDCSQMVWLGEDEDERLEKGINSINPKQLLDKIHYQRAIKSDYEIDCLRVASTQAVKGHLAAKETFLGGGSELEIHLAYLNASSQQEQYLPYGNIVALNEHAAILHYTELKNKKFAEADRHSFLLDAGAEHHGYCSDITRTWAYAEGEFAELLQHFNSLQKDILSEIKVGMSYVDLHRGCHLKSAKLLQQLGFIYCEAEEAVATGITSTFLPHGLGHLLGLQVHDAGGHQTSPEGTITPPPNEHPFLRLTRNLESGYCFTIEPGLYFIEMLLARLKETKAGAQVNWTMVDQFKQYGGIRIEDDVVIRDSGLENLTRDAFHLLE